MQVKVFAFLLLLGIYHNNNAGQNRYDYYKLACDQYMIHMTHFCGMTVAGCNAVTIYDCFISFLA